MSPSKSKLKSLIFIVHKKWLGAVGRLKFLCGVEKVILSYRITLQNKYGIIICITMEKTCAFFFPL